MPGKAKVVLTDYVWASLDVERKTLEDLATLVALKTASPAEFLPEAEDCDALLNTYAGPITADVMTGMPKCRIIARYGIGVDTIDLKAATEAGIIVTNNPSYCIEEVAEHAMALLLSAARKILFYDRTVREGRWELQLEPREKGWDYLLRDAHGGEQRYHDLGSLLSVVGGDVGD